MAYTSYLSGDQFPGQQESTAVPAHAEHQQAMANYFAKSSNPEYSFKTYKDLTNLNMYHSLGQSGHL